MAKLIWKTMKIVNIYIKITVTLFKLIKIVILCMIIIHYYTYLGRHKYDYLNKSKGINSKYSTKNNKYKTRLEKINYTNNENSKYLQHYHGHI